MTRTMERKGAVVDAALEHLCEATQEYLAAWAEAVIDGREPASENWTFHYDQKAQAWELQLDDYFVASGDYVDGRATCDTELAEFLGEDDAFGLRIPVLIHHIAGLSREAARDAEIGNAQ